MRYSRYFEVIADAKNIYDLPNEDEIKEAIRKYFEHDFSITVINTQRGD